MSEQKKEFLDRFNSIWIRLSALLLILVLIGFFVTKIGNVQLSADTKAYFNEDDESLIAFDKLEADFSKDESIVIVVESKTRNLFSHDELEVIQEITEESWQQSYVVRVDSLTNYQYTRAEGDELIVEDLFGDDLSAMASSEIEKRKVFSINQPELLSSIISGGGEITAIIVSVVTPGENKAVEVPLVVAQFRELIDGYAAKNPGLDFHIGGQVFLNNAFSEISQSDIKKLYPLMLLIILILLYAFFRMLVPTILTMIIVVLSCLGTMGVAGFFQMSIASIVINAPIMVMSLALADCVHVLVNFYAGLKTGMSRFEAVKESVKINFKAVSLTTITTAIGFLSLNFSESPPFRDLGNLVAVGVLIAYLLSLTVLPILMTILPTFGAQKSQAKDKSFWKKAESVHNLRGLTLAFVVLLIISAISAFNIEVNDTSTEFFSEDTSFRQDAEYIDRNFTGVSQINYSIAADREGGVTTVEYLRVLDDMVAWLRNQPEVTYVSTAIDIIKRLNQDLHGGDPKSYKIPSDSDTAAQYLLLYEMSLPYGLDLTNRINLDKSASRLIVNLKKSSATELLEFDQRFGEWLSSNAPPYMLTKAASPAMMFAYVSQNNALSMIKGMLVALVLISLILVVALKSIRLGCVSLLMNCTPILVAFGVWSLLVGEAGLGVSLVLGISLGIVVDNSIHFLTKYRYANRVLGQSVKESLRFSLNTVGKALLITTVSVSAGFLVISTSNFSLNADMGIMTSLVIVIALVVDLVFIPPIIERFESIKVE